MPVHGMSCLGAGLACFAGGRARPVPVAFQAWATAWPSVRVHRTVQPLIAEPPAVTVASPGDPPGRRPTTRQVVERQPGPGERPGGADALRPHRGRGPWPTCGRRRAPEERVHRNPPLAWKDT